MNTEWWTGFFKEHNAGPVTKWDIRAYDCIGRVAIRKVDRGAALWPVDAFGHMYLSVPAKENRMYTLNLIHLRAPSDELLELIYIPFFHSLESRVMHPQNYSVVTINCVGFVTLIN